MQAIGTSSSDIKFVTRSKVSSSDNCKSSVKVCFVIKDKESRLYLHANRLKMYYPEIKKDILFETATPNEFKKIMN